MKKILLFILLLAVFFGKAQADTKRYYIGYVSSKDAKLLYGNIMSRGIGTNPIAIAVPMFVKEQGAWQRVIEYPLNHGDSGLINHGFIVRESDGILDKLRLGKPITLPEADEVAIDSTWSEDKISRFIITWPEVNATKITMQKKSEIDENLEVFLSDDEKVKDIRKTFKEMLLTDKQNEDLKLIYTQTIYSIEENELFAVLNITLATGNMSDIYEIVLEKTDSGWKKLFSSNSVSSINSIPAFKHPVYNSFGITFKLKFANDVDSDGKTDYVFALEGYNFDGFMLYNEDVPPIVFGWGYH